LPQRLPQRDRPTGQWARRVIQTDAAGHATGLGLPGPIWLHTFAPHRVSAVTTQTLREAHNRDAFLVQANSLLGHAIQVISGDQEARLIYQGVAQALPDTAERRLVIDIGGRSTELIVGCGYDTRQMASYPVGSVLWSMLYFADGALTPSAFTRAEQAATSLLAPALAFCAPQQWDVAYGSAGTVNAVVDVLAAAGWPAGHVSQEGLDWLLEKLLAAHSAGQLNMLGLREDRKAIIGAGHQPARAITGWPSSWFVDGSDA